MCRSMKPRHKLSSIQLHPVGSLAATKFVDVTVDSYMAEFKVDSGAAVSVVPSDFPT